jgi:30S ribosomal protein S31
MGKGDKKSKRGKIWLGSFGVSRPKKKKNKRSSPRSPEATAGKESAAPKKSEKKK